MGCNTSNTAAEPKLAHAVTAGNSAETLWSPLHENAAPGNTDGSTATVSGPTSGTVPPGPSLVEGALLSAMQQ
jgi:hypothetical protein